LSFAYLITQEESLLDIAQKQDEGVKSHFIYYYSNRENILLPIPIKIIVLKIRSAPSLLGYL